MEFGQKGTSRLVADVTGSRHSGLGFTVLFWLFTAVSYSTSYAILHIRPMLPLKSKPYWTSVVNYEEGAEILENLLRDEMTVRQKLKTRC